MVPALRRFTFVLVLVLAGCDAGTPPEAIRPRTPRASPSSGDARVIGLVGTFSGPESWRGDDAFEGAQVAVGAMNRLVDPGRPGYELVTRDDRGDPATATQHVIDLTRLERIVGIVYAGPPEALARAEDALAGRGIPAILCYGDLYSARLLQPHVFQNSPPYLWQARTIARYLADDRRYQDVGIVTADDLSGRTARASLEAALDEQDLTFTSATYEEPATMPLALRRLRRARAEAVIVQGNGDVFAGVAEIQAETGSTYRTTQQARIGSARPTIAARRPPGWWRPQLVGFDSAISPGHTDLPRGTVAADTYGRGKHYLPLPNFERFRAAFMEWWDGDAPLGWEHRAYDAARMLGWAAQRAGPDQDLASVLEAMRDTRFAGLDVTLGPDDHTAVEQTTIGLWVVPREDVRIPDDWMLAGFDELPWLPLGRGFTINGRRTNVLPQDWRHLFVDPPPPNAPAPRPTRMRYAVSTPRSDPVH